MWRVSGLGMQIFEFGKQRPGKNRKGEAVTIGSCFLHVCCAWRVIGRNGVIVGGDDYPGPTAPDPASPPFDFEAPVPDERLSSAKRLFNDLHDNPPMVRAIKADKTGSVRFQLSGELILEIIPLDSRTEENWRLLFRDNRRRHFVVTGQGIDTGPQPRKWYREQRTAVDLADNA